MKTVSIKLGKKNRLVKIYKLSNKMLKNHKVILTTTDLVHNNFIVNGFGDKAEAIDWLDSMGYKSDNPIEEFVGTSNQFAAKSYYAKK